jgi:transposase
MAQPPTIGLDLAQNVFQGHGADTASAVVCHRPLRRSQLLVFFARLALCLVGVAVCAGAHHRVRELAGLGDVARLMPPAYAKP